MKRRNIHVVISVGLLANLAGGCGYHVAGHGPDALPKTINVIAVPAIENKTTTFKIEQKLTGATIHEFLAKTRYKIVSNSDGGDAVLTGKVLSLEILPLIFQTTNAAAGSTAQATAMVITMRCEVTLTERDNDKVLYHTDNFVFRGQYQLATCGATTSTSSTTCGITNTSQNQVETFFQEGDPALDRMAQDFAGRLVSAVTENF